jgi:hypothetical protein
MVYGHIEEHAAPDAGAAVERCAADVLADLYQALAGEPPRAVRAYREAGALLLLMRFDPAPLRDGPDWRDRVEATFIATAELLAEAVGARCGRRLHPGAVELCGSGTLVAFSLSLGLAEAGRRERVPAPERPATAPSTFARPTGLSP